MFEVGKMNLRTEKYGAQNAPVAMPLHSDSIIVRCARSSLVSHTIHHKRQFYRVAALLIAPCCVIMLHDVVLLWCTVGIKCKPEVKFDRRIT